MRLNKLQQKIISILEPLPIKNEHLAPTGIIEPLQIRIGETVTGVLRSLRRGQPMVWDPWILKDGDIYRLFYLEGLEGQIPWWTISKICGAISTDMKQWQYLGTILEPEPANDWESGRVCAGCTYKEDGVYYLFYSAGGKEPPHLRNEAIGLATSTDGIHFSRYSHRPLLMPEKDDSWYGRSNWTGHFHWRDPYIFKDEHTGNYYMFICAGSKVSGNFQGCVGLAVADKISGPYKLLPPAVEAPVNASDWPYYHLERPQVIYKNGKYNLFFSCFKQFFNPNWLQKVKHKRVTNSSLYWYIADNIAGPYEPVDNDEYIVKGSEKTGMYGTNFLQISDEPEEFIAYGWYHRIHALEVSKAFQVIWKHSCDRSSNQQQLGNLEISLSRSHINPLESVGYSRPGLFLKNPASSRGGSVTK
ncbi:MULTISPECIES: family 43 glycosylhydrolase [Nostocales]|uniref:Beta-fructosidase n=3 Tax=Nostocales TaxID=1161 RepID=A0A8S9TBF3_9CYAN|nr:family 43 glycosylhydrolase [Tolypothrix bouteillei]KAF3889387.1 beta-fructosidase [Tolypothrix bouteillei VB521301]